MKELISSILLVVALATTAATPETSKLFVKHVDPESGVESLILKPKIFAWNQQSVYFTAKSMTDDGRFLVFDYSDNEFDASKHARKRKAVIDFDKDEIFALPDTDGSIPFLDPKTAKLIYTGREGIWMNDLRNNATKRVLVCPWPKEFLALGKKMGFLATHLTLTQDRKKAFIDTRFDDTFYHGCINLETGAWEHWGSTPFFMNHGQLCPSDDNLAMGAWEVNWVDSAGKSHPIHKIGENQRYPRMWYVQPGDKRRMIDPGPEMNYATHEMWDEDGRGHYWNNWSGLWHYDRFTEKTEKISPFPAGHSSVTRDLRYVISDFPVGHGYWRGNAWSVVFYDRQTGAAVFIHSRNEPLCSKTKESRLHPDPHPAIVCNEKYVITTINNSDGHMDLCLTPIALLRERCAKPTILGQPLPAIAHPIDVGERIGQQFFRINGKELAEHGDPATLRSLLIEYSKLTANHRLPLDIGNRGGTKARKGPVADREAVRALELIKSVLAGDTSKTVSAREAWVKAVTSSKDWTTLLTAVNLMIAADSPAKTRALEIEAPVSGEVVSLTIQGRKDFLKKTAKERRELFLDKAWRNKAATKIKSNPEPVVLRWFGKMPKEGFQLAVRKVGDKTPVVKEIVKANEFTVWNLEIAREYEWVVSDGERKIHGRFATDSMGPRDMYIEGVQNFRDLGGWVGLNGRRVKQGMVYRSQGLNCNADFYLTTKETLALYEKGTLEKEFGEEGKKMKERIDREKGKLEFDIKAPYLRKMLKRAQPRKAKERLTAASKKYLLETLGIKTDIDLRGPDEVWGMTESPLGPTVQWVNIQSFSYGGMGQPVGKAAFTKVFKIFLDEKNYPIDIHCIGGADRTGCDCYVLNALLGVDDDDLAKDWEITCFEYEAQNFGHKYRFDPFLKVLSAYPGNNARERCEAYVKELGFTDADIEKFRSIMLEK